MIEMMVSIAIGLVVIGAVSYVYLGAKGTYRGNESVARIQEAGRFALDSISRDVRRAGALGCGSFLSITNQPVTPSVLVPNGAIGDPTQLSVDAGGNAIPVYGFAPAAYATPPYSPPAAWTSPASWARAPSGGAPQYFGGDILQLQIASGLPARMSAGINSGTGTITIADNTLPNSGAANFNSGDYALLADCSSAAVFQVTNTTAVGSPPVQLSYAIASGQPPSSISVNTFPTVQHYDQITYYVGKLPNGLPALYRYSMNAVSGAGAVEAVIDNVEDLDVQYGVGVNGSMAGGTFKRAGTMTAADWSNVISIEVSVIATGDQFGAANAAQALTFHGTNWVAPDTRLRQIYSVTTSLRDRLQ
jgi:type IV pilus assembly protein PilW